MTWKALLIFPPLHTPPDTHVPHFPVPTRRCTLAQRQSLTRPGLSKQMADGLEGTGPLTPLVTPLGVEGASLLRRLQLAAIHLHRGGLGQDCLNVSVCHWVFLLLGGIKHLHVTNSEAGERTTLWELESHPRSRWRATPAWSCKRPLLRL